MQWLRGLLPELAGVSSVYSGRLQLAGGLVWLFVYFRPSRIRSSIQTIQTQARERGQREEVKRYTNATLFLCVALFVSCLRTQEFQPALAELSRVLLLFAPVPIWALSLAPLTQSAWEDRFWRFQLGVGIVAVLAWLQYLFGYPSGIPIPALDGRAYVTLGHHSPLQVASILVFPVLMTLDGLNQARYARISSERRVQMSVLLVFGVIALFFTYSKTVWLSLVVSLLVSTVVRLSPKRAFVTGLIGGSVFLLLSQHPALQFRLTEALPFSVHQAEWSTRFSVLSEFTFTEWLFGLGELPVEFGLNQFLLEMLRGTGLIGLGAFVYWWVQVLLMAINRLAQAEPGRLSVGLGFLMAAFSFFVINSAQILFWTTPVLIGLAVSVAWILPRMVNKAS